MGPKVSVVVPLYNMEPFVGATVESVLRQTCVDFELIVLDNVSTDRSAEVVRQFRDERIRLVTHHEHVGVAANCNRALAEARGEYVKVLPADDVIYPHCLERQLSILDHQPGVSLVTCHRDILDEQGHVVQRPRSRFANLIPGVQAIRRSIRAGANPIGEPATGLFRRAQLQQVGGIDDRIVLTFDMDLWFRLLLLGDLYVVPEPLAGFRISRRSLSFSLLGKQTLQYHQFIREVRREPRFGVRAVDALCGRVNSLVREVVRWGAYRYYLGR